MSPLGVEVERAPDRATCLSTPHTSARVINLLCDIIYSLTSRVISVFTSFCFELQLERSFDPLL